MRMYYKIIVSCVDFHPKVIMPQLKIGEFVLTKSKDEILTNDPEDYNDRQREPYGFGYMHLNLKDRFSDKYSKGTYEENFVKFYEDNYQLLKQSGADDFQIFLDVFLTNGRLNCDFEIFDKEKLAILAKYNVALPISIYRLDGKLEDD